MEAGVIEDRIKHRHLTCFEEVARQKSIGKAAMSLAISQPAVSKTIRELEEILGVELFDRTHRSVELTAYGEVFLRYASASIAALRLGVESVDAAIKSGRPVLKVGAVSSAAALLLPEAVARFLRYGASAVVRVVPGDNAALLSRARMGELDLALVRMSSFGNMVGLTFEHLHHDRLGGHLLDQFAVERTFGVDFVEFLGLLGGQLDAALGHDAQAGAFDHGVDRAGQVAARGVGLDDRESAFGHGKTLCGLVV